MQIKEIKSELDDIYLSLITETSRRTCPDDTLLEKITLRYNQMINLTDEQLTIQHSAFRNYASIYADEIARTCQSELP